MPSKDPINKKANAWRSSDPARPSETRPAERTATGSRTAPRAMSSTVLRLAARLGVDADEMASKIPPDTLRRTKYPLIERALEGGKREYEHDLGVNDSRRSTVRL